MTDPADDRRIVGITLDEKLVVRRNADVEHERAVAIFDLIDENRFILLSGAPGPYHLHLSLEENRLHLDLRDGAGADIERVTEREVITYSAGGFRDFTRIAASNPAMWRDIFLTNKDALLATLHRFNADLAALEQAIVADDGPAMFELFTRTAAIRRGIVEQGQDVGKADFGRGGS